MRAGQMSGFGDCGRFLSTIIDSLRRPLAVLDRERRIVLANRPFLAAVRAKHAGVIGQYCAELCRGGDGCPVERAFSGVEASVLEQRTGAEGTRWIERSAFPVDGGNGRVDYVVESLRDVTAEHELSEVWRRHRTFCHEISNPLFAALGTAELMANEVPEGAMAHELSVVIRNLKHIDALTRQMQEQNAACALPASSDQSPF